MRVRLRFLVQNVPVLDGIMSRYYCCGPKAIGLVLLRMVSFVSCFRGKLWPYWYCIWFMWMNVKRGVIFLVGHSHDSVLFTTV